MLLPEWDHEMQTTRKYLERVPVDKLTWKPHAKSMTLGQLAGHVAEMPGWGVGTVESDFFDMAASYKPFKYTTTKELLDLFDKNVKESRSALEGASDETFGKMWALKAGDQTILSMPKIGSIRSVILNHVIHHRGQLSVYLRQNDVPVPSTYGPSADENN